MNAIMDFDNLHADFKIFSKDNIEGHINEEHFEIFKMLATSYKSKFDLAKEQAEKAMSLYIAEYRNGGEPQKIYDCPECGHENFLIPNKESQTGFQCVYCDNEESYDIEAICSICGAEFEEERMFYLDGVGYVCIFHELNPEHKRYND